MCIFMNIAFVFMVTTMQKFHNRTENDCIDSLYLQTAIRTVPALCTTCEVHTSVVVFETIPISEKACLLVNTSKRNKKNN